MKLQALFSRDVCREGAAASSSCCSLQQAPLKCCHIQQMALNKNLPRMICRSDMVESTPGNMWDWNQQIAFDRRMSTVLSHSHHTYSIRHTAAGTEGVGIILQSVNCHNDGSSAMPQGAASSTIPHHKCPKHQCAWDPSYPCTSIKTARTFTCKLHNSLLFACTWATCSASLACRPPHFTMHLITLAQSSHAVPRCGVGLMRQLRGRQNWRLTRLG